MPFPLARAIAAADSGTAARQPRWMLGTALTMALLPLLLMPVGGYRLDLDVYRTGAHALLAGGDLYGPLPELATGMHLPFTYPPIAAWLFAPLTWVPLPAASLGFTLASLATLVVGVAVMMEALGWRRPQTLLLITGIALTLGPVRETLSLGQVNIMLTALVLVGTLRLARRPWCAGILIGAAVAIKLTPAVFLVFLLFRRDWRRLASTLVSACAWTGIGFVVAPTASVTYWTSTLLDPSRIGGLAFTANQSVNGLLQRLGGPVLGDRLAWLVIAGFVGLLLCGVAWVATRRGETLLAWVAVAMIALACSPVSWSHHWVSALPLLMLIAARREPWRWSVLIPGVAVFLLTPHWWLPHSEDREMLWTPVQHVLGNLPLAWAMVALLVCTALPARGSGPRLPQEGQHGLHPAGGARVLVEVELGEDRVDVFLDRLVGDDELPRNLGVGVAFGHPGEHLCLARCQPREAAAEGLLLHEGGDDLRVHDGPARGHGAQRPDEADVVEDPVLEEISDGPSPFTEQLIEVQRLHVLAQ